MFKVATLAVLLTLLAFTPAARAQLTPARAEALPQPVITRLRALSASSFALQWRIEDAQIAPSQVLGFRVYRDGLAVAAVGAGVREWKDSGLTPSTVYLYAVAAVVAENESAPQAEVLSPPLSDVTGLASEAGREASASFDAVVVGATPSGIAAALTMARLGHSVALVSPSPWLGGMMTGGLSRTDFGSAKSAGGLFKEFVDRVAGHYNSTYGADSAHSRASRGGYYFEPRVAKWVFHQMLAQEPGISVMLDHHSRGVEKAAEKGGARLSQVYVLDRARMMRKTLSARVFIDATYEGDLAAQAGALFRVGRESRQEWSEEHAGELFWEPTRRRVVFGSGRGDLKVQSYNFRLCLSREPDNRLAFPPPERYSRERYTSLLPDIASGRLKNLEQVLSILPLPGDKWDANNHPLGNPSSDLIGGADAYPEADIWARETMARAHREHILGLMYFVQHDGEVPASFRLEALRWGLARDEFVDNGGFPTQLYVREGRRIVGTSTFTENDARSGNAKKRPTFRSDSVAVADYPIDSHATSWEKDGLLEGFFYLPGAQTQPSQVPWRSMTPLGTEGVVEGLIVSVCVSSTHIGYGTLRMEPVFMALGTAAGVAAHLSLSQGVPPSRVPLADLQRSLLALGQVLCVFDDVPLGHPHWEALQYMGTKGFFPLFEARPNQSLSRLEAREWMQQWMRRLHPQLESPKVGGSGVPEPLGRGEVLAFEQHPLSDEPLSVATAGQWIRAAVFAVAPAVAAPAVAVESVGPDRPITRGEMCRQMYDAEMTLHHGQ